MISANKRKFFQSLGDRFGNYTLLDGNRTFYPTCPYMSTPSRFRENCSVHAPDVGLSSTRVSPPFHHHWLPGIMAFDALSIQPHTRTSKQSRSTHRPGPHRVRRSASRGLRRATLSTGWLHYRRVRWCNADRGAGLGDVRCELHITTTDTGGAREGGHLS